ncbi:MAG: type pilus assembly protein PilM [Pseudonocardiales bacterium]|jgi:type IV pilus assembly protein PilM|nr:type pilus assembly protein PilM [Pseudonocardiales bacterium]MDT4944339.1 type pilus assembly protein PilM [Pseudonocardiales bacterium]
MKHRQVDIGRLAVINTDGHAIGVDIGAGSVRAAVLAPGTLDGRPSVTVHGLGQVELPPNAVVNGVVVDQAAVTQALKSLWASHKFECRRVILGITNQQVVVRDLTVPNLEPEQLAKALPYQAREVVPLPMDQALIDFMPLGGVDEATDTIAGLLVAAPRGPVLSAVQAVERAGLSVARVDLSSFAVLRSIADQRLAVEAVIDIGAHMTSIVVHNQGVPKVVRVVPRGGQELTQLLVARGELSEPEAELAKRAEGLIGSNPKIVDVLSQGVRPILSEIRSSIQYFTSMNPGARLEQISLSGGGALLPGLAEELAEQVGVPTRVITPMHHISNRFTGQGAKPSMDETAASAVSVGLAMGAAA